MIFHIFIYTLLLCQEITKNNSKFDVESMAERAACCLFLAVELITKGVCVFIKKNKKPDDRHFFHK